VWALEAHRAAQTLQEMLTLKSDDIIGRAKSFQAIIKGQDIPAPTVPESFRVLVKELGGLGLKVSPIDAVVRKEESVFGEEERPFDAGFDDSLWSEKKDE
ncbi:hypothetical protein KKD61_05055, partial [Patescibacteria group bacterium]|nr:hypothetical protein [Patescibacteria group bacterium]